METKHSRASRPPGFTLVELLIVITIIMVLAALIFVGTQKGMAAANKARNVSQMREIGAAVASWASEHNNGEPMYFANGTGDEGHEGQITGKNPLLSPGNPAILLYSKDDPASSYLPDHSVFFSPLSTFKVPDVKDYDPANASDSKPWGTFVWLYPSTSTLTPRQEAAMGDFNNGPIGREAAGNVIMANHFDPNRPYAKPRFDESHYALFRNGSVKFIGNTRAVWNAWYTGKND